MNYLETINYGNKILKSHNINTYNLDSELILANVLNSTREEILTNLDKKVDDINLINTIDWYLEEKIMNQ